MTRNKTKFRPRFIDLSPDKIVEIAEIKHVTTACVRKALRYDSDSPVSMLIRAWAKQNGGIEYTAREDEMIVKVLDAKGNVKKILRS